MAGGIIGKVTADGGTHLVTSTFYGTCDTAANLTQKIVKLVDSNVNAASFITGMTLAVKFVYSNTQTGATSLTIQNSTSGQILSQKSVKLYGSTIPGNTTATSWRAGAIVLFVYDGESWIMVSGMDDYNSNPVQIVRW